MVSLGSHRHTLPVALEMGMMLSVIVSHGVIGAYAGRPTWYGMYRASSFSVVAGSLLQMYIE